MRDLKTPSPVAWLRSDQLRKLGEPGSDAPLNEQANMMMLRAAGTQDIADKYGHDVPVVTINQAEAYKDTYVRETLEQAAMICDRVNSHTNPMTAGDCADAIRALIKEQS